MTNNKIDASPLLHVLPLGCCAKMGTSGSAGRNNRLFYPQAKACHTTTLPTITWEEVHRWGGGEASLRNTFSSLIGSYIVLSKHLLKCVKPDLRIEKEQRRQSRLHVWTALLVHTCVWFVCVCVFVCLTPELKIKSKTHKNGSSLVYLPFSLSTKQYTSYFSAGSRTPYVLTPTWFSRSPVHPGRGSVIGYLVIKKKKKSRPKK